MGTGVFRLRDQAHTGEGSILPYTLQNQLTGFLRITDSAHDSPRNLGGLRPVSAQ